MKYKFSVDFETDDEVNNIAELVNGYLGSPNFKGEIIKKTLTKSSQREKKENVVRVGKEISKVMKDKGLNLNQLLREVVKQGEEDTKQQEKLQNVTNID
jgi:hypothetical protein